MKISKNLILLLGALSLIFAVAFSQYQAEKQYSQYAKVYQPARQLPPFSMFDEYNQSFKNDHLKNHWSFVLLGYLSCPDICPITMAKLSNLLPKLEEITEIPIQVLFISVDPKRDTFEKRQQYVQYFHSDIKGLGGEHEELYALVTSLGLMYSIPDKNAEHYFVDHSASVAVIDPNGNLAAIFKPKFDKGQVPSIHSKTLLKDFEMLVK